MNGIIIINTRLKIISNVASEKSQFASIRSIGLLKSAQRELSKVLVAAAPCFPPRVRQVYASPPKLFRLFANHNWQHFFFFKSQTSKVRRGNGGTEWSIRGKGRNPLDFSVPCTGTYLCASPCFVSCYRLHMWYLRSRYRPMILSMLGSNARSYLSRYDFNSCNTMSAHLR